jgi:large subunit ribosomal protein L13
MKTFMLNSQTASHAWFVIDATDHTLGRLAVRVADILRGKNKPTYTPHVDGGDDVIILNAEKIKLTGKKWEDKFYYHYSGHNGGLSKTAAKDVMAKFPTRIVEKAIKGMLPHNSLGAAQFLRLHVYAGPTHKHQAQKPQILEVIE